MAAANDQPAALTRLSHLVISGGSDAQAVLMASERAAAEIQGVADDEHRMLFESGRLFLLGMWSLSQEDSGEADGYFTRSLELAELSLSRSESSEAHRRVSNALQQLLELRGLLFQMTEFRRALDAARRAVQLDSESPEARMSLVSYLASAPSVAGGNRDEALRQLERAEELSAGMADAADLEFLMAVWRARLSARSGDRQSTASALAEARAIYPESWLLSQAEADIRQDLETL